MRRQPAKKLLNVLALTVLLAVGRGALAQNQGLVVRDGSLGASSPGVVPAGIDPEGRAADYLIGAELGEQRGRNLFHSFERFGIGEGETATFTGPDPIKGPQSVDRILSRVTGGAESEIDGTLRSTVPGSDVYLVNPAGVVFGDGARLDVPAGFYATTADRVEFGAAGNFDARLRGNLPTLAVSAPEAFGFTAAPPARIVVDGGALEVPHGQRLALVGGDLSVVGSAEAGFASGPGGDLQLISVASPGRVGGLFTAGEVPVLEGFSALGTIRITHEAVVDASSLGPAYPFDRVFTLPELAFPAQCPSGICLARIAYTDAPVTGDVPLVVFDPSTGVESVDGLLPDGRFVVLRALPLSQSAGRITVRGGELYASDSELRALNLGPGAAGIDVELTGGLVAEGASELSARTGIQVKGKDDGQSYLLEDVGVFVSAPTSFSLLAGGSGDGGDIGVRSSSVSLLDASRIAATSEGSGAGGHVTVSASGAVELRGARSEAERSAIFSNAQGTGAGGDIRVEAETLSIREGGGIFNQTTGDGDAGDIWLHVGILDVGTDSQIDSSTSGCCPR